MTSEDSLVQVLEHSSAGLPGFTERVGLGDSARLAAAEQVLARVDEGAIEIIRVGLVDPHGLVRSKSLTPMAFATALANGLDFSPGPYLFDSGTDLIGNPFSPGAGIGIPELEGAADFVAIPDPTTFVVLPWAPKTGWILCTEFFKSGRPIQLSGRQILRQLTARLQSQSMTYVIGLEVEWYLTRLTPANFSFAEVGGFGRPGRHPEVEPVNLGYQFNSDHYSDALEELLAPLRGDLMQLGLPLRTIEHESGPGQIETTFAPLPAMEAADAMVLFRTAVKQSCARRGLHATFMCKPALNGADPSGWHLHQSLYETTSRRNLFMSEDLAQRVSKLGRHFAGGLIKHAPGVCLFSTPTLNGYRRYDGEHGLAPSRAGWSDDSRGAMLRVLAAPNDPSSHFENRSGEPAANPYLFIAAQLVAGLDGLESMEDPGPIQRGGQEQTGPLLPTTLRDAVNCACDDKALREGLGAELVDFIARVKVHEIERYESSGELQAPLANGVSEWEQREYFSVF